MATYICVIIYVTGPSVSAKTVAAESPSDTQNAQCIILMTAVNKDKQHIRVVKEFKIGIEFPGTICFGDYQGSNKGLDCNMKGARDAFNSKKATLFCAFEISANMGG
ncbi:hypothetical protein EAF04_009991 [Stromatinia cepivora]|nr:hypothetical protein EAF04_009991 [Stromatinia cepivora]